jgi:molybdopterin-guanine dinucleotide biosynthesis protein MobB
MAGKVVVFVARSGTGKTTMLEKLIADLKARGYRVGAVKHDAHGLDIDHPGKDSYRLAAAGAEVMLITSREKLAVVRRQEESPPVEELIATYCSDMDIVLTEGFKASALPKIELHRRELGSRLICRGEVDDPWLVAVASDEELDLDVPVLDLDDTVAIADFIVARFLTSA